MDLSMAGLEWPADSSVQSGVVTSVAIIRRITEPGDLCLQYAGDLSLFIAIYQLVVPTAAALWLLRLARRFRP